MNNFELFNWKEIFRKEPRKLPISKTMTKKAMTSMPKAYKGSKAYFVQRTFMIETTFKINKIQTRPRRTLPFKPFAELMGSNPWAHRCILRTLYLRIPSWHSNRRKAYQPFLRKSRCKRIPVCNFHRIINANRPTNRKIIWHRYRYRR